MSEQTALSYQELTRGQLVAFQHNDGAWYLCAHPAAVEPQYDAPIIARAGSRC